MQYLRESIQFVNTLISNYRISVDSLLKRHLSGLLASNQRQALRVILESLISAGLFYGSVVAATKTTTPLCFVSSGSMEPTLFRGDFLLISRRVTYKVGDIIVYTTDKLKNPNSGNNNNNNNNQQQRLLNSSSVTSAAASSPSSSSSSLSLAERFLSFSSSSTRIVHRIISMHRESAAEGEDGCGNVNNIGEVFILTKGDNNKRADQVFYPCARFFIPLRDDVVLGKVIFKIPFIGHFSLWLAEKGGTVGRIGFMAVVLGLLFLYESQNYTNSSDNANSKQMRAEASSSSSSSPGGVIATAS